MFNLGIMNLRGYGVLENSPKAVHWFEEGAKLGDSEAQFFHAVALAKGQGTIKNLSAAKKWFAKSAEQGLAAAQFNLAILMLREGKKEESIELLKKASGQNHTAAIFQLAGEYLKNPGDVKDQKKAFQLMQQLAEAGEAKAQMQIGLMYIFANGTETNFEEGYFWLREAALSGFSPAQNSLSTLLMQGIGKDPNLPLSYAWSSIASGNMLEESEQQAQIKKKLKPNELQLAHNLVEEIKELIQGISAR